MEFIHILQFASLRLSNNFSLTMSGFKFVNVVKRRESIVNLLSAYRLLAALSAFS